MSYSLRTRCFECVLNGEKNNKCIDERVLSGAVFQIHQIGFDHGHLGSGSIDLNCSNFIDKKEIGKSE